MSLSPLLTNIFVTAGAFFALVVFFITVARALTWSLRLLSTRLPSLPLGNPQRIQTLVRRWCLILFLLCAVGLLVFSTFLIFAGRSVWPSMLALFTTTVRPGFWQALGWALVQIIALIIVGSLLSGLIPRLLPRLQRRLRGFPYLRTSDARLDTFFATLAALLRYSIWLFVLATAAGLLGTPAWISETLQTALRVYLFVAGGRLLVSTIGVVVDTIDALSEQYIRSRALDKFYGQLRTLIPLLSRTLEYIIYVQAFSLAIGQVSAIAAFAQAQIAMADDDTIRIEPGVVLRSELLQQAR